MYTCAQVSQSYVCDVHFQISTGMVNGCHRVLSPFGYLVGVTRPPHVSSFGNNWKYKAAVINAGIPDDDLRFVGTYNLLPRYRVFSVTSFPRLMFEFHKPSRRSPGVLFTHTEF